jgi:hypothetical protein
MYTYNALLRRSSGALFFWQFKARNWAHAVEVLAAEAHDQNAEPISLGLSPIG